MKKIHTREQLIHEIEEIIWENIDEAYGCGQAAIDIADLIADLPNTCFHETSISTGDSSNV